MKFGVKAYIKDLLLHTKLIIADLRYYTDG